MPTDHTAAQGPRAARPHLLKRRLPLVLAALVAAGAGYYLWHKFVPKGENLDNYQIATVQRGDIEDLVTATGTLQPRDYVDIGAQVSGQLKKIHVQTGSIVAAGTLLAEIDPTVFLANVDARRASLRNLQATLLDRQSQLLLAELQFKRQKNLAAGDATTTESVQAAEAGLGSAKAQVLAVQAQIEQTQSTLRADEANLNFAKIYAPIAGVVVSITARQGQTLNANQSAPIILRIADLSTMTVQTQVSEADVSRLSPNMETYFTTLGNRGQRWYGKLTKVEPTPTVTNNVVLYNALFDVPNTERRLLPQMTAQVFFVAASARDTLFIPAAALTAKTATNSGKPGGKSDGNAAGVANGGAPGGSAPGGAENSNESREERRARFANMSEEERAAMRARRAEREQNGEAPPRGDRQGPPGRDGQPRDGAGKDQNKKAPNAAAELTPGQVFAGVAPQQRKDGGEATIKVVNADNKIEERKIQTGVTNRIQVQVLSGLAEGDRVIIGVKPQPGAAGGQGQSGQQRNALQPQGIPGMGPGGPR